jgi:undecaprenyl-diphosphatase
MDIFQPIIFGLIQGLTEFLPISSSAHLILLPKFFNWTDPGLNFNVALHFGTLLAVISYFKNDLLEISKLSKVSFVRLFKRPIVNKSVSQNSGNYNEQIVWLLIVATIPGVIIGYFLNDLAEEVLRNPAIIVVTLIFFGGLLYWADKTAKQKRTLKELNFKDALLIGIAQGIALIPGTSRSGITITIGLLLGLSRTVAARFSFLMSIPIILGAVVYKFPDLLEGGIGSYEILGILVSATSGYLAIAVLMKFINKVSYKIFFWYRIVLAVLVFLFLTF